KLVNLIIQEAISLRASDIHIEPFRDRVRVRYRIEGVLFERDSMPRNLLDPLLARIKFMSNIAVPKRPEPQDGRIKHLLKGVRHLFRQQQMNFVPTPKKVPDPLDGRIK